MSDPEYGHAASALRQRGRWVLPTSLNPLTVALADGTSPEITLEQQPRAGISGPKDTTRETYLGVKLTPLESYSSAFGWQKWLDAFFTSAAFSGAPVLLRNVQEALEAEQQAQEEGDLEPELPEFPWGELGEAVLTRATVISAFTARVTDLLRICLIHRARKHLEGDLMLRLTQGWRAYSEIVLDWGGNLGLLGRGRAVLMAQLHTRLPFAAALCITSVTRGIISEVVHQHRQLPGQPVRLQQPSLGARLRSLACLAASSAPALVQVSANLAASGLVSHLVNASVYAVGLALVPSQHWAVQLVLSGLAMVSDLLVNQGLLTRVPRSNRLAQPCRVALVCSASCLLSHAALFDTSQEQLERRLLFLFLAAPAVVLGQLAPAPGQAASLKPEAAAEQAAGSS